MNYDPQWENETAAFPGCFRVMQENSCFTEAFKCVIIDMDIKWTASDPGDLVHLELEV